MLTEVIPKEAGSPELQRHGAPAGEYPAAGPKKNPGRARSKRDHPCRIYGESMFELPDFIEQETWDAFEEARKEARKPLTEFAKKRVIHKLINFHCQGYIADEMLGEAIERGWRTVFMYQEAPRRNLSTAEKSNVSKITALTATAVKRP
jgi:hypothetical protein